MSRPRKQGSGRARAFGRRAGDWVRRHPGIVFGVTVALVGLGSLAAGLLVGSWESVCRDCPSIAQIYTWEPKQATKILDHRGQLIAELFEERRTPVQVKTLPEYVRHAFIAVEDKRFYQHDGIDERGIARALITRHGGGSTITQQLARNMFENIGFERKLTRKLKEARVAREIEAVYSKDQILEAYINQVNYGHGWRGIETASQHYFGKPAVELNPAEAAMLAAAINAPGRYSPFVNPDLTLRRRNLVLGLMAQQGYLPRAELEQWRAVPLPTERHGGEIGTAAPYFVEWVRDMLDNRFGADLYSRGLRVHTTLDMDMQRAATAAMDSGWARIERAPGYRGKTFAETRASAQAGQATQTPYIQGAFIAMDPATGDVRALIGGRDFKDSKFNRATQALRQVGSTFKPFVYAAALASGLPASHIMHDAPLDIPMDDGSVYSPKNYDPSFRGALTLRDALKWSVNTVAVQLGIDVGLETVAQTAHEFGITTPVPPYPSTSIGAPSVLPIQMAAAYTVFANGGAYAAPRFVLRVEDADGRVLWQTEPTQRQVADSLAIAIARDMMRTVVDNGTGYPARDPGQGGLPYTIPAAGKTGTTNDNTDVWFAGFTPNLLAVVWFGFDRPQRILPNAAGGVYAAPVWGRFMRAVYTGGSPILEPPEPWPWPQGIIARQVDRQTGQLASSWCPADRAYTEYFIPGTEPTEVCDPYRGSGLFGTPLRQVPEDTLPPGTPPPGR